MTAVAKSQLNPLANAFIPAIQNGIQKKHIQNLNATKNRPTGKINEKKNTNDRESERREMAVTLNTRKPPVLSDIFLFGSISTMLNIFIDSKFMGQNSASITEESQLPVIQECPKDCQELVKKSNMDLIETPKETADKEIECNCPAMFGWIIPPEFVGNPLNLKSQCSKKYPHSSNSIVKESDVCEVDSYDKIDDFTLEQCYSEIKNILVDVYMSTSFASDPKSKWDEKRKIKDFIDASDCEMPSEERISSNSTFEDTTELVDDGWHPLLQSSNLTIEEDEKELVEKVEKILQKSLHSSLPESLNCVALDKDVCDPPCSVWCDFLPLAAKDTFKKYIHKSGSPIDFNEAFRLSSGHRPSYKRSLSADDAPICGRFNQNLSKIPLVDTREMLLLQRKDPLNYFRVRSSNNLINGKKLVSSGSTNQQFNSDVDKSNMWGKFDSSDSLWQPLPDCTPMNVNQKQNCHNRDREARRQRPSK